MKKFIDTKIFFLSLILIFCTSMIFNNFFYSNFKNQVLLFLIPLLWPGLAHGSLDILTAQRKNIISNNIQKAIFYIIYLAISIIFFTFWLKFPNKILSIFLILSFFHFGIGDSITTNNSLEKNLEIFIRGTIIICFPFEFFFEKTQLIFIFFLVNNDFILYLKETSRVLIILSFLCFSLLLFLKIKKKFLFFLNDILVFELLILFFCFFYFEPLISFFIYFCFLHSVRHLIHEKAELKLKANELFLKTLPILFITLTMLILAIIHLKINNQVNESIKYIIIALASLTIPHILLVNFSKFTFSKLIR